MDWTRGYTSLWRLYRVNRRTWADSGLVGGVDSFEIDRSCTGDAPLLETCTMKVDAGASGMEDEEYYRIVMVAQQGTLSERVEVGTFLCTSASGTFERGSDEREYKGWSVLRPAATRRLQKGEYAPRGVDAPSYVADMLRDALCAPVEVSGSFVLEDDVVFDIGSSVLEAAWAVLEAGGFCMQIAGDGTVSVMPKPTEPSLVIDAAGSAAVSPEVKYDRDLSEVPNRYIAVDEHETAVAVNDSADSPVSTVSRGYYVDELDESPKRVDGETLAAYAERMLEESSTLSETRTYKREYVPGVVPFSIVRGARPDMGLDGDMTVLSQGIECDRGITVDEKAGKNVYLWRRQ